MRAGRCQVHPADVIVPAEIEPVFAEGLDAVCHIAGQVSIIRSFSDPVADLRTNVEGTLNVLKLCLKYKVPRLVYASSMTLYGQCETIPTPEIEPCRPDSYYGITKHAAERYVHSTAERPDLGFDFSVTSLRMFSVYGPGQSFSNPYQGVLGIFSGNLLRGEPITIFGDGAADARLHLHRRHRRRLGAGAEYAQGRRRRVQPGQRPIALHQPACRGGHRGVRSSARRLQGDPRTSTARRAAHRPGRHQPGQGCAGLATAHLVRGGPRPDCPLGARGVRGRRRGQLGRGAGGQ